MGRSTNTIINDFAKDRFLIDGNGQVTTTERLDRKTLWKETSSIF